MQKMLSILKLVIDLIIAFCKREDTTDAAIWIWPNVLPSFLLILSSLLIPSGFFTLSFYEVLEEKYFEYNIVIVPPPSIESSNWVWLLWSCVCVNQIEPNSIVVKITVGDYIVNCIMLSLTALLKLINESFLHFL